MTSIRHLQALPTRPQAQVQALSHTSSMREKVFEHLLLGQLGLELMHRGVEFEVLHGETDRDGYDVVVEAGGTLRHVQLKVTIAGGARADVTVNTRLAGKAAGCVVWLTFDPVERGFSQIRWFGGKPGEPLPPLGTKVARHSRGNSEGVKACRPDHRVLPASNFEPLDDIGHLADRLFGSLPADPLAFLRSRLERDIPSVLDWLPHVAGGDFTAIPDDLDWSDAVVLGHLVNGYRLLELFSDEHPVLFLNGQRGTQAATGTWPGDAVQLWTTLFLEVRADDFGTNDYCGPPPNLALLARQLRDALIALETTDA